VNKKIAYIIHGERPLNGILENQVFKLYNAFAVDNVDVIISIYLLAHPLIYLKLFKDYKKLKNLKVYLEVVKNGLKLNKNKQNNQIKILKMENIITTTAKFIKVKSELDGLVFWRDLPDNKVEIKFTTLVNKISKKTINLLKSQ
jgi:hypothetical protein